jgi:predicted NAD/FAD-dependent oxidoreductase
VIGAGIAGLSCATMLQQAGLAVSVFDKSRGPAGRMSTRRGDDWQCDHGAQYFTARDPEFRGEVDRWLQAGVAALWKPSLRVLGGHPDRVPDETLDRFVGLPRMSAPARFLADALAVTPQARMVELKGGTDGWHLRSAEHGWMEQSFDAVLLAMPAPQVVPLLRQPAPELAAVAAGAAMRGCWALMLRHATPAGLPFDAAFVNEGPLRWVARDGSKPGRPGSETWLLHASAEWSEAHLELPAESVARELIHAFGRIGAASPHAWTAHRWRYADMAAPLVRGCVWDRERKLGLCGDWLNGGKVEGAWRSGRQLAQEALLSLQPRGATRAT